MSFKENNLGSLGNNNIEQSKKKENFFKRFMSKPLLQKALLAALLVVASPSDIKKEVIDDKNIDPTEVLKDEINQISQDSLILNDSSNETQNESLSEEEYEKNVKDMKPMYQGDKPTGNVTKH